LLWGPYLWADGTNPRSDGLTWLITDLEGDHTHPSAAGEEKVAGLLASFFGSDATAAPWWRARTDVGLVALDALKDAHVSAASPNANFGSAPSLLEQGGSLADGALSRLLGGGHGAAGRGRQAEPARRREGGGGAWPPWPTRPGARDDHLRQRSRHRRHPGQPPPGQPGRDVCGGGDRQRATRTPTAPSRSR
jgi:hypothetical protein